MLEKVLKEATTKKNDQFIKNLLELEFNTFWFKSLKLNLQKGYFDTIFINHQRPQIFCQTDVINPRYYTETHAVMQY